MSEGSARQGRVGDRSDRFDRPGRLRIVGEVADARAPAKEGTVSGTLWVLTPLKRQAGHKEPIHTAQLRPEIGPQTQRAGFGQPGGVDTGQIGRNHF